MFNSANVIMSYKNKTFLISRLNENEQFRNSPMFGKLTNRIVAVSNDGASFLAEMRKYPDACVLLDMNFGDEDAVSFIRRANSLTLYICSRTPSIRSMRYVRRKGSGLSLTECMML